MKTLSVPRLAGLIAAAALIAVGLAAPVLAADYGKQKVVYHFNIRGPPSPLRGPWKHHEPHEGRGPGRTWTSWPWPTETG